MALCHIFSLCFFFQEVSGIPNYCRPGVVPQFQLPVSPALDVPYSLPLGQMAASKRKDFRSHLRLKKVVCLLLCT